MHIEGEYIFDGPRDVVWEMLNDPEVLAAAMPGTKELNQVGENEYEGTMNVRVGPVSGTFSGKLVVADPVPPEQCTLIVDGRGAPGFLKGEGQVYLTEVEPDKTHMRYEGEVQIGGRLAGVGQRMLDSVSKSMIRQGLETVNEAVKENTAAKAEGREAVYTPPSETEFASRVAKDMAGGITSSAEAKMVMYIVPVVIVLVLLAFLLSQCGG